MKQYVLVGALAALMTGGCATLQPGVQDEAFLASKGIRTSGEKAPKRDQPGEAAEYWATMLQTPPGKSPGQLAWDADRAVRAEMQRRALLGAGTPPPALAVTDLGPGNFGGRVRALVIDPDDNDTLLVGGVAGGIWKTEDRGTSWRAIDDFTPNMAIASMIVDPDQPARVFVGTGEGFFNSDAMSGAGIFVSEDFGETWNQLPVTANNSDFFFVNRLARVPGTNVLLAATRSGIFRSTDLGGSFTRVDGLPVSGRGFVDLKVDPTDPDHVLAYLFGGAGGFLPVVRVTAPGAIAGDYVAATAEFGPAVTAGGVTGDIVLVNDGVGTVTDACDPIGAGTLTGDIALLDRGGCNFTVKVRNAQNAGAIGAIVMNNTPGAGASNMGGADPLVTIPSVMISFEDGAVVRVETGIVGSIQLDTSGGLASALARSTDAGATWQQLDDSEGLPVTNYSRMEIAFGEDGTIYVSVANGAANPATRGLWKSTDGGLSFFQTASATPFIERQGWYDLAIAVDPNNSDTVLMGAVDQFRTTNGGNTIVGRTTFWNPGIGQIGSYVHADHHIYTYDPVDAGVVYTGSDGGIARSADNGLNYAQLNNGFNISQPYGIAVSPNNDRVVTGTQDNGTHLYFGNHQAWIEWSGGDGGYVAWDQQNPNFIYGARPFAALFGTSNLGTSESALPVPDTTGAQFITPFVLDPNNGNRLMIGTDNVFLTNNARNLGGASFITATPQLSGSVAALAFSPHDTSIGYVTTTGGQVLRINALNTGTPNTTNITNNLPTGNSATRIEVDPFDTSGQTLYVTFSGFFASRVWKTENGGASWQNLSAGLPAVPAFTLKVDPIDADRLWLGTEIGLWTTTGNSSNTPDWQRYEYGVPHTRVIEIAWGDLDTLYATTHGRGTFRALRNPYAIQAGVFSATTDCDADGILDVGEAGNLELTISNLSGTELSGVTLALNSLTPALSLPAGAIVIGTIAAFDDETVTVPVALGDTPGVACPARISIDATLTSTQGSFDMDFDVDMEADIAGLTGTFVDGAESAATLMTPDNPIGGNAFVRSTAQANGGTSSWFAADPGVFSESSLSTPWFDVNAGPLVLSFDLFYDTEFSGGQLWDGAVLEMRSEEEDWFDIGNLSTVPYDGLTHLDGPLPARRAWGGNQQSWRSAIVDLGTIYQGERVQFRFRMASDSNTGTASGFFVDNFNVANVSWDALPTCDACSTGLDTVAPVVTAPADITMEATAALTPVDLGAGTAIDNIDGTLVPMPDNPGPFAVGLTTVTWSATDAAMNTGTDTQSITITDTTAPALVLAGSDPLFLLLGTSYVEPGASASDLVDGDLSGAIMISGTVDGSTAGSYPVQYQVSDAAGNVATETRSVVVQAPGIFGDGFETP